jgi:hypothetical protein
MQIGIGDCSAAWNLVEARKSVAARLTIMSETAIANRKLVGVHKSGCRSLQIANWSQLANRDAGICNLGWRLQIGFRLQRDEELANRS